MPDSESSPEGTDSTTATTDGFDVQAAARDHVEDVPAIDRSATTDVHAADDDTETITLSVEVPAGHMTDTERRAFRRLATLYENAFEEICVKNRDYSWAFLTGSTGLARSAGYPIDDPTRAAVDGLLHRTGDKRERLIENVFGGGSAIDADTSASDPVGQTATEAANYYFLLAFCLTFPDLAHELAG